LMGYLQVLVFLGLHLHHYSLFLYCPDAFCVSLSHLLVRIQVTLD
jgi:hypothetical protein